LEARPLTDDSSRPTQEAAATPIFPLVLTSLDEDKAQDVVSIDLAGKTAIADQMVIASGRSQRHVGALADHLVRRLKEAGYGRARIEGLPTCDWVLIDAGDVIVHIFRPEVRDFYRLEKLWGLDVPSRDGAETRVAG
jgi:ribosome-associated protein